MYHKSRRHGPKSGHSYYLERKELVSIQDGGNVYIKNTQTHVRELYRLHFPIQPDDIVSSSKGDVKILETARQVKKLNMKIGDEINKLKKYRDLVEQEQARKQKIAKEQQKTTKNPAITQGEKSEHQKERKSRKLSSPNAENTVTYFRTARVSSATRSENSSESKNSDEKPRESGGCSYGYNESMSLQSSVYQVDYGPGMGLSCQCPAYCYPGSCPCYAYSAVRPDYCSPNPYSQYPMGGVYQQQTAFERSRCTCPCVTCSRRTTDLNTDEYLRNLRPSPQSPRRSPSPEPKKKKKSTPQYPTAKSAQNQKRVMKVFVRKPSAVKTKEQPKRADEKKVIPKKEKETMAKQSSEESEEIELEKLRLHRQYMEMYKEEHEKTAKKESSAHSSDLEPHATYTKLTDKGNKLKDLLIKPEPLSLTEFLEEPQEEDFKKDLPVKQSPSLHEVDATEDPQLATQPETQEEPSVDPHLCQQSCQQLCHQSCQTDIKSTSELELELNQFPSSSKEIPTQTDQEFSPRNVREQEEEYIECHTVCVTKKIECLEVVYESPIERKHQSEPMLRSKSTIIAEFDQVSSAADLVPVTQEPSAAVWQAPILSSQSEIEEVYSFPENTQLSQLTESPRSDVNESEDHSTTVVSKHVSDAPTLQQLEESSPVDALPVDSRSKSPIASPRTLYSSEDSSPDAGHRLDYRKQQVFYAPTYHLSELDISEQLYARQTQVFYTPTPSYGMNLRSEEGAQNYSFSLESRAFHSSVESASDCSLNLYTQMNQGVVSPLDSNRTPACLEQCSPDCSQQFYSLKDHVFYTPTSSNRTYQQSEHSSPERTFNRSEESTYGHNQPGRDKGYKPDSSSLKKSIVCEKRTRSVTFEDESGPSSRVHTMRSCRSRSNWEGVTSSDGDKSYREFDRDDSSVLLDSCRTSSSADCTCVESNNEDYESCNESKTQHFPPFSACPCMRDQYSTLAALCKPINR